MINVTINNVYCQINELQDRRIIDEIDNKLSYYKPGYAFTYMYKTRRWDGKQHLLNNQLRFQTGLLHYVIEIFAKHNVEYEIIDNRQDPVFGKALELNPNYYIPRDYQLEAKDICLKEKCGIVKMATGGGKTLVISLLCAATNIKTLICVISIDLLYQTKKAIEDALGIEVGIVGDGQCIIKKITVATPWTISHAYDKDYEPFDDEENKVNVEALDQLAKIKIQKMVEGAQMFIVDECQMLACATIQLLAKSTKNARLRFGFSGSPWRDDDADILLEASTGRTIVDINASSLIQIGVLTPPKIYFLPVPEMQDLQMNNYDNVAYQSVYDKYIVENETRNDIIITAAKKLFDKHRKTLILVRRKKHGLKLLEMMPKNIRSYYLNGDAPSEERQAVKDLFNVDGLDVIISSTIFDIGIDLPKLDALILAAAGKSSTRALQRIGRVIRSYPGKDDAIVVDFLDHAPFLYHHSNKRNKIYATEKGFKIIPPKNA